jgi:hypothetical protein
MFGAAREALPTGVRWKAFFSEDMPSIEVRLP